jgi:hypothetical protein
VQRGEGKLARRSPQTGFWDIQLGHSPEVWFT